MEVISTDNSPETGRKRRRINTDQGPWQGFLYSTRNARAQTIPKRDRKI